MGLLDFIKSILDIILPNGEDPDDSHGAPRGDTNGFILMNMRQIANMRGYRSVAAMRVKEPALYDWAKEGAKWHDPGYTKAYLVRDLEYNKWLQSEPGLVKPRKIVYMTIIGSRYWKYKDEGQKAWKPIR